jgi:hypothetical protein
MNQVEQCHNIRFEKRGREFVAVARLSRFTRWSRSESKKPAARFACEGPRVNAREVTAT